LVVLDRGEQVVGALVLDQVPGGFPLDVHGVGGDQRPADVHLLQQGLDLGDLVGLVVHIPLGDHRAGTADHRREQVRGLGVAGPGPTDGLAVQRDDQLGQVQADLAGKPPPERRGQGGGVHPLQHPPKRHRRRYYQPATPIPTRPQRRPHPHRRLANPFTDRRDRVSPG